MAIGETYEEFVEKFKPKKTTDDCYTPEPVYDAILEWVRNEYNIGEDVPIIRPFYPGGDYEHHDYPEGCVVVDNPPFSILKAITDFYLEREIKFFLFAPGLTLFSYKSGGGMLHCNECIHHLRERRDREDLFQNES